MRIQQSRRKILGCVVAVFAVAVSTALTGCVPSGYAVWEIDFYEGSPAATDYRLVLLEKELTKLGYIKFEPIAGLIASYWLPPSGQMMIRIKQGANAQRVLVIFTEEGEKSLSPRAQKQVDLLSKAMSDVVGSAHVRRVEP